MTTPSETHASSRIDVLDALRGFAILSILLLHNVEHFDLYFFPEYLPQWLKACDGAVWSTLFFLFSGKSYAIFALLFGVTFQIQLSRQQQEGGDFRWRFAWRLLLLLGFGVLNTAFFSGDILGLYAIVGLSLIPVCRLGDRAVLAIALLLMAQPLEWLRVVYLLGHPDYVAPRSYSDIHYPDIVAGLQSASFVDAVTVNLGVARLSVMLWFWEHGRVLQTAALFMLGMLLGRRQLFLAGSGHDRFWRRALAMAALLFVPLFYLKDALAGLVNRPVLAQALNRVVGSWSNLALMVVLVSLLVLLFQHAAIQKALRQLIPLGRMTLTNYVMQSVVGSAIYYGYGLGLYQYTGATLSMLVGLALITLQWIFCRWWLGTHRQGPLEALWHRATWLRAQAARGRSEAVQTSGRS